MARRGRSSLFEDIIELTATFPWWVGAVLAIVSYLWLHPIAVAELPKPSGMPNMGAVASASLFKGLATFGQYILPLVFLIGAAISFFKRKKGMALHAQAAATPSKSAFANMSWRGFETLVGEAFRQKGFDVVETGGGGADGGIDLVLNKGSDRYFVQCKQWKALKVGVAIVRELYGVMAAKGAAGGFVVTSGEFTEEARSFAAGRSIILIAGDELHRMIRNAESIKLANTIIEPDASPVCPKCGSPMVKRHATRGANTGQSFWGCSTYPKCRGTRAIEQ
ncbi:MAG: restriction endonuclease [Pseudomonadota bacterium]